MTDLESTLLLIMKIGLVVISIFIFVYYYLYLEKEFIKVKKKVETFSEDGFSDLEPDESIFDKENEPEIQPILKDYKTLFDAKTEYLTNIIDDKFTPDTITKNRYIELIEKSKILFNEEIQAANRIYELNVFVNEKELSGIYDTKIENIEMILTEIEGLMLEFIKSEYQPDGNALEILLDEIDFSKKNINDYVTEENNDRIEWYR